MYTQYFNSFNPNISRKVRCLAARLIIGSESDESIHGMTQHGYVMDNEPDWRRTVYHKPILTVEERDMVLKMAGRRV